MQVVKIKNINKTLLNKKFIVKGRIKPYAKVVNNAIGAGVRLMAILFDKSSCIQLIAFNEHAYGVFYKLRTNDIISIINASVVEVSTQKQITTNHKYQLTLTSETIITPLSDYAESLNDFPNECKFIKGSRLSDLKHGAFVDVMGRCVEFGDILPTEHFPSFPMRFATLLVDDVNIQLAFLGEKSNEIYEVGSILKLYNAQYRNINGASLSIKSFTTVVEVKPLLKLADNKQESVLTSSDAEFEKEDQKPQLVLPYASDQNSSTLTVKTDIIANTDDCNPSTSLPSPPPAEDLPVSDRLLTAGNCEPSMSCSSTSLPENLKDWPKRYFHPSSDGSDSMTSSKKAKIIDKQPMDNNTFVSIALRLMASLPEREKQDLILRIFSMIEDELAKY